MKKILYILSAILLFLLSGCIHEQPEDGGIDPTLLTVEVNLSLNLQWQDFQKRARAGTRSAEGLHRRFIVEVRQEGKPVLRQTFVAADFTEEQTTFALPESMKLHALPYTVWLWTDYVAAGSPTDLHYNTANFEGITLQEPYTANTDARDCLYATAELDLRPYRDRWNATVSLDVELVRPLAKYRIIATDVEKYLALVVTGDYPPVEELTASIHYEGFFPSSFNVAAGGPNDATTGISYTKALSTPSADAHSIPLGSDLILVNGGETFVTVTLLIADSQGTPVSRIPGVRIDYRRGYITTISGNFLMAGKTSGGIHIDTDWEDDIIIEF